MAWLEVNRGVVFPWNCDHYGHMNVRWYSHFFDDANMHLWSAAGVPQTDIRKLGVAPVVAMTKIDFLNELRAGDMLVIRGGFIRVGSKSLSHILRMHNADNDKLCAREETTHVFFDLTARRSTAMPDYVREKLTALLVNPDEGY